MSDVSDISNCSKRTLLDRINCSLNSLHISSLYKHTWQMTLGKFSSCLTYIKQKRNKLSKEEYRSKHILKKPTSIQVHLARSLSLDSTLSS